MAQIIYIYKFDIKWILIKNIWHNQLLIFPFYIYIYFYNQQGNSVTWFPANRFRS